MLGNVYSSAAVPVRLAATPLFKTLAVLLISGIGIMFGSAAGAGLKLAGSSNSEQPAPEVAKVESLPQIQLAFPMPVVPVAAQAALAAPTVTTSVAAAKPAPAAVAAPKPKPVLKPVIAAAPVVVVPVAAPAAAACAANQRMDDTKVNWLLDQSAKTLAANPGQAAGAAKVTGALQSAQGKNLCAPQVQQLIGNTCADAGASKFLNTMVGRLPFFIKPMIGNPCTADLVAVMNKLGKFIS